MSHQWSAEAAGLFSIWTPTRYNLRFPPLVCVKVTFCIYCFEQYHFHIPQVCIRACVSPCGHFTQDLNRWGNNRKVDQGQSTHYCLLLLHREIRVRVRWDVWEYRVVDDMMLKLMVCQSLLQLHNLFSLSALFLLPLLFTLYDFVFFLMLKTSILFVCEFRR